MSHNPNPGNPYNPAADHLLHQSEEEAQPPHSMLSATQAFVQATLNLAFEQRTANLIALYTAGSVTHNDVTYGLLPERAELILKQINERLGLPGEPEPVEATAAAQAAPAKGGPTK
jgi:hypothetical protein